MRELSESQLWQAKDSLCRGLPWLVPGTKTWIEPLPGRCRVVYLGVPTTAFHEYIQGCVQQINAQPWARQIWENHNSHTPMRPVVEEEGYW